MAALTPENRPLLRVGDRLRVTNGWTAEEGSDDHELPVGATVTVSVLHGVAGPIEVAEHSGKWTMDRFELV